MKRYLSTQEKLFIVLACIVLFLGSLNVAKAQGRLIPPAAPVAIVDNTIILDDLTLEQKIAQMVIVAGVEHNREAFQRLQVGGIHLFALASEQSYQERIESYQEGMNIPFFVTVDLEGCLNPFAAFRSSEPVSKVTTPGEAFQKGRDDGRFLANLGFGINYAPVVDLGDAIWQCRSFPGNSTVTAELAQSYILGLQNEGVIATAKHYPGKTLVIRDPHKNLVEATIDDVDVYPYEFLFSKGDVNAVMVSHVISSGAINSHGIPAVVDPTVIEGIRKQFDGLIISDEINMLGLRNYYGSTEEMYLAVFAAGNDLILSFNEDPQEIYHMIRVVARAVDSGEISEEKIDESVRKILEAKGFRVH